MHTCTGNGLSVSLVLDVTGSKDTGYAGEAGSGLGSNVSLRITLNLVLDDLGGGLVADGIEETVSRNNLLGTGNDVLDLQVGHQTAIRGFTGNLGGNSVKLDLDLGVVEKTSSHGLGGSEMVLSDEDSDAAAVLGQEHGLLSSRVTTTNDKEWLVTEDWDGTVADSTGTDTVLPVLLLTGQVQTLSVGTGSHDDGIGSAGRRGVGAISVLLPDLEWTRREVNSGDGLGDNLSAESGRLLAHVVHERWASDALGETREVLDLGGGGELTAGSGATSKHTLVHNRLQLSSGEVDGGGVGGRAGTDDCRSFISLIPIESL